MKSSKSPSVQKNTILSYFSRTPSKQSDVDQKTPLKPVNGSTTPKSAIKSNRTDYQSTPKGTKNKIGNDCSTPNEHFKSLKVSKLSSEKSSTYQLFDIVWAKLEGYPPWPAIICDDPATNLWEKSGEIHVKFFDELDSHAWIIKREIKPFIDPLQSKVSTKAKDSRMKQAIKSAEEALAVERIERFKFIGNLNLAEYGDEEVEMLAVEESDKSTSSTFCKDKIALPAKRKKIKDDKINNDIDSDSESFTNSRDRKRFKRVLLDSSDEESSKDDYKPHSEEEGSSDEYVSDVESENNETPDDDEYDEEEEEEEEDISKISTASKKGNGNKSTKTLSNGSKSAASKSKSASRKSFSVSAAISTPNITTQTHIEAIDRKWPHLEYDFLQPENISDAKRQKMFIGKNLNPDYDPSTLYVPNKFLDEQTAAQRQWWEFKSQYFDTILFFKLGKFYEFLHMDAVIVAKELQILFMRGNYAHAGFPEKSYKRYADALIQRGYKVARIEQSETPEMMEQRNKGRKVSKFQKVVNRVVCRVSSLGTRYMSDIDSDALAYFSSYLFALNSQKIGESLYEIGICFVEVSLGKFYLTQFKDDHQFSKLRTVLSHYLPVEIIYTGSSEVIKHLELIFPNSRKQHVRKFWESNKTLKYISENEACKNIPEEFKNGISEDLLQTCKPEFDLAVSSLGGIIEYLEKALIADDILSMGLFELYSPLESSDGSLTKHLILDFVTIKNLDILDNLRDEESNSLFKIINNCCTAFGKRHLRSWLCLPLCNLREELELRQEAVRDLAENQEIIPEISKWCAKLKKLPDLERLLTQIHTQSLLKRSKDHPDSRAILFESDLYSKRRISNFLNTLDGFETVSDIMKSIFAKSSSIKSKLLLKMFDLQSTNLSEEISFFRGSFNAEKVRAENKIIPMKGVDAEYDESMEQIASIKKKLADYLREQCKIFKTDKIKYGSGKNRNTLEVPSSHAKMCDNNPDYKLVNCIQSRKRYSTSTLKDLLAQLDAAQNTSETVLQDIFRRLLERFDKKYQLWSKAINCIATLDALISLSKTKQTFETNGAASCIPEFVWSFTESSLRAKELNNACLIGTRECLIANDIELSNGTLVLTGPNMAGKTTLMRSVGLLVILAQIGSYVPAQECILTPVDRIFTRIGAYDQVIESQSTFMIELSETVTIVKQSTPNSLVLIDELGRGTSTFDGIAIAHSVLEELAQSIHCRCIFSTHFHAIVDDLKHLPAIKIGHMEYKVENENKDDPTEEDVIFLYKLKDGVCSKSYGYNVAKMAGLPREVIRNAYKAGNAFELKVESCRLLDAFMQTRTHPSKPTFNDEKLNQLADYLSEIFITQDSRDISFI